MLDTYFYFYAGYMDDYLESTLVNDVGIKYLLMKKIGQKNGVIAGFMKTYLFEDMTIWKHGLLT